MAAEAARVLDYETYNHGSAAPALEPRAKPKPRWEEAPQVREQVRRRERARPVAGERSAPGVSLFAVFGAITAVVLMVFVVLAQITHNEVVRETVRLNARMDVLLEQQRALEIRFESVIDMKEVESYARDVLGMSKPDPEHIMVIQSTPRDRAEVLSNSEEATTRGFGSFISSLLEHFR